MRQREGERRRQQKLPSSQRAGCRYVYVSDSKFDSENESDIPAEKEKCCVCKLFSPEAVRRSLSLVFVKWGECS